MNARLDVAVLCGGISDEDYLSRRSAVTVLAALREAGFRPVLLDWQRDNSVLRMADSGETICRWDSLSSCFADYRPDVVFNALHGERENSGQLQGFMDLVGIPLTGNPLAASVIGMDKALSLSKFDELGVRRPRNATLGHPRYDQAALAAVRLAASGLNYPLMLKRTLGGSSGGLEMLANADAFPTIWDEWSRVPLSDSCRVYAEEFIDGTEYCVGVFGHFREPRLIVLPVVEIVFEGRYFDKEVKYNDRYVVRLPQDLDPSLSSQMSQTAEMVHRAFGFVGFSRLDFRVDNGEAYALEVNTHPGLSQASIITNTLPFSSLTMRQAAEDLVRWSMGVTAPVEPAIAKSQPVR